MQCPSESYRDSVQGDLKSYCTIVKTHRDRRGQDAGRPRQDSTTSRLIPGGCDSSRLDLRVRTCLRRLRQQPTSGGYTPCVSTTGPFLSIWSASSGARSGYVFDWCWLLVADRRLGCFRCIVALRGLAREGHLLATAGRLLRRGSRDLQVTLKVPPQSTPPEYPQEWSPVD